LVAKGPQKQFSALRSPSVNKLPVATVERTKVSEVECDAVVAALHLRLAYWSQKRTKTIFRATFTFD
jgi:hypothetical protein